jgi:hypothetical protein
MLRTASYRIAQTTARGPLIVSPAATAIVSATTREWPARRRFAGQHGVFRIRQRRFRSGGTVNRAILAVDHTADIERNEQRRVEKRGASKQPTGEQRHDIVGRSPIAEPFGASDAVVQVDREPRRRIQLFAVHAVSAARLEVCTARLANRPAVRWRARYVILRRTTAAESGGRAHGRCTGGNGTAGT